MRGTYQYAPLKLVFCKIIKSCVLNEKSPTPDLEVLAFVEGEYMQYNHTHVELPALSKGDYLIFIQSEWSVLNQQRKLITNIYAPDPLNIERVSANEELATMLKQMDRWLSIRLNQGHNYQPPSFAIK